MGEVPLYARRGEGGGRHLNAPLNQRFQLLDQPQRPTPPPAPPTPFTIPTRGGSRLEDPPCS